MNRKINIIILVLLANLVFGQETQTHKFKIEGFVGLNNVIPLEGVQIITDSSIIYSDSIGEFILSTNQEEIHLNIQHLGFNTIDTTLNILQLNTLTSFILITDCGVNRELAQEDIKSNEIKLYLSSGVVPTIIAGQQNIENSYNFKYEDFGCLSPAMECIAQYNNEIFKYFDEKYNSSWRRVVRKDVVGFEEYIKKIK